MSPNLYLRTLLLVGVITTIKAEVLEIPRHHRDDQILNQMLAIERYDSRLRPEAHTIVNVSITLLTLSSPDESSITYEVEFLLHLIWNDHRLKYEDRGKHKYLNALKHTDKLWVPDLYFIKHGKMPHPHNNDIIAMKIFNNGDIHFTNRYEMKLTCFGNIKIFPFDDPKCFFAIESKFITHERHQLELKWNLNGSIEMADSFSIENAYLISNSTKDCNEKQRWRQEYSCLSVILLFTRDKSFYLSTFFIPSIILVSITFISFWLDVEAVTARIFINLSAVLGLLVLSISFRAKLPIVSNMAAINLWEFVSIFFIFSSIIEFLIIYYRHRKFIRNKSVYRLRVPSNRSSNHIHEDSELRAPLCAESIEMTRIDSKQNPISSEDKKRDSFFSWKNSFQPNSFEENRSLDDIFKFISPLLYYILVIIFFLTFSFIETHETIE